MNIRHIDVSIRVSPSDYIQAIVDYLRIDTANGKKDDLLNKEEAAEVRAHIGRLRWLADQTRPDIAYDVLKLSIVVHKPTVAKINKTVTAINSRSVEINYNKLSSDKWVIRVFSDASL